jgi:uncharacterized membrane protein YhiD involved in acid resistance
MAPGRRTGGALLLSAAIGLEREIRQKDAGLRTHTLVDAVVATDHTAADD